MMSDMPNNVQEDRMSDVVSGTFADSRSPGVIQSLQQGGAAFHGAMAAAAAEQVDAGRFLREWGAAVVGGHAPVGDTPAAGLSAGVDPDKLAGPDASD